MVHASPSDTPTDKIVEPCIKIGARIAHKYYLHNFFFVQIENFLIFIDYWNFAFLLGRETLHVWTNSENQQPRL